MAEQATLEDGDGRRIRYEATDQLRPEHTALVLVDLQNDFVHPDGWVARQQMAGYLDSTTIPDAVAASAALLAATMNCASRSGLILPSNSLTQCE